MSAFGWIVTSLIALIITGILTSIIFFISMLFVEDYSLENTIFGFIIYCITSVLSIIIFDSDFIPHKTGIIFTLYGIAILLSTIQLLLQYFMDEVFYVDDGIIKFITIILYLSFSTGIIIFGSLFISSNKKFYNSYQNGTLIEQELTEKQKDRISQLDQLIKERQQREIENQNIKIEKQRIKEERQEAFRNFVKENKIFVLMIVSITMVLLICIIIFTTKSHRKKIELRIKHEKEQKEKAEQEKLESIHNVAEFILYQIQDIDKIENAQRFISDYNKEIRRFKSYISSYERKLKEEENSSWTHKLFSSKIEEYTKEISNIKRKKTTFETKNRTTFAECETFLSQVGEKIIDTYNNYKPEIIKEIDKIKLQEKENHLNEIKQEFVQKQEKIQKETVLRNEEQTKQQNEELITRSIKQLEDLIPIIQNKVSNTRELDFKIVKQIKDYLDKIENSKDFIPSKSINNIERCKEELIAIFNFCNNKNELLEKEINLITESFNKILSQ